MNEENLMTMGVWKSEKKKWNRGCEDRGITFRCVFDSFFRTSNERRKKTGDFSVFPLYGIEDGESEIRVVFQQYLNRQSPNRMDAVTSRQTQYNSLSLWEWATCAINIAVHFSEVKRRNNKSKITRLSLKHSPTGWRKYFPATSLLHQFTSFFSYFPLVLLDFFFFFGTAPAGRTSLYSDPTLLGSHLLPLNDQSWVCFRFLFFRAYRTQFHLFLFVFSGSNFSEWSSLLFQVIFSPSYPPSNEENSCDQVNDDDERKSAIATWMPARLPGLPSRATMEIPSENITMRNRTRKARSDLSAANELLGCYVTLRFSFPKNNRAAYPGRKSATKR